MFLKCIYYYVVAAMGYVPCVVFACVTSLTLGLKIARALSARARPQLITVTPRRCIAHFLNLFVFIRCLTAAVGTYTNAYEQRTARLGEHANMCPPRASQIDKDRRSRKAAPPQIPWTTRVVTHAFRAFYVLFVLFFYGLSCSEREALG